MLLAICIHDLGMVSPLKDKEVEYILKGKNQVMDPTKVETYIREYHHDLVDNYLKENFNFLTSIGIAPTDCALIAEISKCHRKRSLTEEEGLVQRIGALLRAIDELDIGPERAPADVLINIHSEIDQISCWHWFKHNIVESWRYGHNVISREEQGEKQLIFKFCVRPTKRESIVYWINQIKKPLLRVLLDDGAAKIIQRHWRLQIKVEADISNSKTLTGGEPWPSIEKKAFSKGLKSIILIDDVVRKMEDLLLPLMRDFSVVFSPNAKDALTKIAAMEIDLVIVDMQIGSGGIWPREETQDGKATGKKLCEEILRLSPNTKIGVLTGTRYDCACVEDGLPLSFFMRKPVDPDEFEEAIYNVLR